MLSFNEITEFVQNQSLQNSEIKPNIPGVTTTSKIIVKIKTDPKSIEACTICLNEMATNLGKLSCDHTFHFRCIDRWIRTSATCPICRKVVFKSSN